MRSSIFAIRNQSVDLDIVLLLIRIVVGSAFAIFGWGKIQHPMSWMGPESAYPGIFQALAAISECIGGIALIFGLVTRLAAFGIACTMLVAVYVLHFQMGAPFLNLTGGNGYVLPAVFWLIAVLLIVNGPGRFSLDKIIFGVRFLKVQTV